MHLKLITTKDLGVTKYTFFHLQRACDLRLYIASQACSSLISSIGTQNLPHSKQKDRDFTVWQGLRTNQVATQHAKMNMMAVFR